MHLLRRLMHQFLFSFIPLFSRIFLKISNFNWPGLGRDGADGRSGLDGLQPWPIEIWNFKILSGVVRKQSESVPKSSETVRNRLNTVQKRSETTRNIPKRSENGPKPSETIRKRSETVRNCPKTIRKRSTCERLENITIRKHSGDARIWRRLFCIRQLNSTATGHGAKKVNFLHKSNSR